MARGVLPVKGVQIRKDGKAIVRMRPRPGEKELFFGSFPSVAKANAVAEKIRRSIVDGNFADVMRIAGRRTGETVEALLRRHPARTPTEQTFARFWTAGFGELKVADLTPTHLLEAIDALEERELEPQTVLHYMKYLRRLLNLEVEDRRLQWNPFSHSDVKLPSPGVGKVRYIDEAEEARLLEALGPKYRALARFAILTGLRRTEQFTLEWRNVDLERRLLTLEATKGSKLRGERSVEFASLTEEAVEILRSLDSWQFSRYVFPAIGRLTMTPAERETFARRFRELPSIAGSRANPADDAPIVDAIREIRTAEPGAGYRTLVERLAARGLKANGKRVRRLLLTLRLGVSAPRYSRADLLREYEARFDCSRDWLYKVAKSPAIERIDVPMNSSSFYRHIFLPAVASAKVDSLTWHTLRHTFASRLAMLGKSPLDIAKALRHTSGVALVAKRYAHLSPGYMRHVLEGLDTFKGR